MHFPRKTTDHQPSGEPYVQCSCQARFSSRELWWRHIEDIFQPVQTAPEPKREGRFSVHPTNPLLDHWE